jgi:Ca2+-binding RTX toxin-like protein
MSLLSRNTGGGRRRLATTAAVFAGTLLTYLVVTAIPAMAVTTCAQVGATAELALAIDSDDVVTLAVGDGVAPPAGTDGTAGTYVFSVNGGAFADCGGAADTGTIDWVHVTGSNAGQETLRLFHPRGGGPGQSIGADDVITVDLANGNDTLIVEQGALASPAVNESTNGEDDVLSGSSATGVQVLDAGSALFVADTRIDNAEVLIVNGHSLVDTMDAGNFFPGFFALPGLTGQDPIADPQTGDNIPAANDPLNHNVTFNGLAGDDLFFSGNGNDTYAAGAGNDGIGYNTSAAGVTVDLTAGTATGMGSDTFSDVQDTAGSAFNDTITGNTLSNNIIGNAGDDVINAGDGADGTVPSPIIFNFLTVGAATAGVLGAADDDTITGGAGNDVVQGNAGDDLIDEGAAPSGTDTLSGGPGGGCDEIFYGARTGAVTVNETTGTGWGETGEADTGAGFELFVTGAGADTIVGDSSDEIATPGAGNDTVDLNGNGGPDPCGIGFDFLDLSDVAGPAVFNLITGTATGNGTDTFFDTEGYIGTAGNDSVVVGDTNANGNTLGDFLSDGGEDTVDATANTTGLTIDLSFFGNGQEVENALGGSGNDILTGNVLNNRLIGNDGNDVISAGTGNDFVEGGQGNDILSDGGGADRLSYRHAPAGVTIDLASGFASGGDGEDTINGGFEIVLASNFNDNVTTGQTAFDAPFTVKGFKGADSIIGSNSTDTLKGGAGNDQVRAGGGDDLLAGAAGNDLLLAGSGDDRLKGGKGRDRGVGGPGFDVCSSIEVERSCEA